MAELGFEEGIGFITYVGIGYEIFKTVTKEDSSPVRLQQQRNWRAISFLTVEKRW